jgi:hypothetical protein
MDEKGKICRSVRAILLNIMYFHAVTANLHNHDFDNIVGKVAPAKSSLAGRRLTFIP